MRERSLYYEVKRPGVPGTNTRNARVRVSVYGKITLYEGKPCCTWSRCEGHRGQVIRGEELEEDDKIRRC